MIENHTILCFASGYDAPPTSKHHIMHLLAERNTVLWVNYHASRTPSVSGSDMAYLVKKLKQVFQGLSRPRKNLNVLTPLVVPLPSLQWAKRLNHLLLVKQVRTALGYVHKGPVQVWTFDPDIAYLLGNFGEEKVVYYCVDDHASFTGYDADRIRREETRLCQAADLVVTTSSTLQQAKCSLNPHTILVPHGVDYEHFSKAVTDTLAEPDDLAGIPHPRLGFFGLIRDWVDVDLMAELARRRPDWHVVLLGDSTVDLTPYRALPNMHFLGRKPYAVLPAYCRHWDAGLIPFRINELTLAVNPIKLREYLAAGLPVVSTPLPEVLLYKHWAHLGDTPETFLAATQAALATPAEARRQLSQAMLQETWPRKLQTICDSLENATRTGSPRRRQPQYE